MSFIIICDKLIFFSSRFGLKHGNLINMLWTGTAKKDTFYTNYVLKSFAQLQLWTSNSNVKKI